MCREPAEFPAGDGNNSSKPAISAQMKGAWITTVWNTDYPAKPTTDKVQLEKEINSIVSKAAELSLNALFFQVRPSADALYKSEIFPWSKFLTGKQGLAPNGNFDPLAYMIEKCHGANIRLHAWINPFRITTSKSDVLSTIHPASLFPELTIKVGDTLFFNPGLPAARALIIDGVREIAQNYDVDGINFDDYFYPEALTTEDLPAFALYGNDLSIQDWRRNNVDKLIYQTHLAVKEIKPDIVFGVSPSGIWANKPGNPLGSDTWGFESYNAIYADSRGWVKNQYVDYIAPQIYWYIGQKGSDFATVLDWWNDVCKDTGVTLYAGLAGYKIGTGGPWNDISEFENQQSLSTETAGGFIIFTFNSIAEI